ncbi:MAG: pitrilysin family protein [Bacteroidota bacterium]
MKKSLTLSMCVFSIAVFTALWFLVPVRALALTEEFTVNGLKVILKRNPGNEVVAASLYIRGGVFNLTPATAGIEPLLFDVAVKGTQKYPKEVINAELARMGTQINGNASKDYSGVNLRCIKPNFDKSWDIFADVLLNPTLDPKEVELSRAQALTGLRQRRDNPDSYLRDVGDSLFYEGHPYGLDPSGTEESVSKISVDQMWQYLKDNLVTSKLLLVVVGDIERADLEKKVASAFGALPVGDYAPQYPAMVSHAKSELHTVAQQMPTNYILGYFSAPSIRDADYYPMSMAMSILQQREFEEVRTKRNLSYAPSAYYQNQFANCANIYVTAVKPDTTIKVMLGEAKRLQTELISPKELRDKITVFLTSYYLQTETNAAQASFLARYELAGLGWQASEMFVDNMKKVTPEDVERVAQKYIKDIQFVVIGDPAKIDEKVFTSM